MGACSSTRRRATIELCHELLVVCCLLLGYVVCRVNKYGTSKERLMLLHFGCVDSGVHSQVQVSLQLQYPFIRVRRKGAADARCANPDGGPQAPVLDDKTREAAEAFEAMCMR